MSAPAGKEPERLNMKVAIIGAGLTGLLAAHGLQKVGGASRLSRITPRGIKQRHSC